MDNSWMTVAGATANAQAIWHQYHWPISMLISLAVCISLVIQARRSKLNRIVRAIKRLPDPPPEPSPEERKAQREVFRKAVDDATALINKGLETLDLDLVLLGIAIVEPHVMSGLQRWNNDAALTVARGYRLGGIAFESIDMLKKALDYLKLAERGIDPDYGRESSLQHMSALREEVEADIKALEEKLKGKD
jgi:hypothetical protein